MLQTTKYTSIKKRFRKQFYDIKPEEQIISNNFL